MALDILTLGQDAKDVLQRTKVRLAIICMLLFFALCASLLEAGTLSITFFLCAAYVWFLLLNAKMMESNSCFWTRRFANIKHSLYDLTLLTILFMNIAFWLWAIFQNLGDRHRYPMVSVLGSIFGHLYQAATFCRIHGYVIRSLQYFVIDWKKWTRWLWLLQLSAVAFLSLPIQGYSAAARFRWFHEHAENWYPAVLVLTKVYVWTVLAAFTLAFAVLVATTLSLKNRFGLMRPERRTMKLLCQAASCATFFWLVDLGINLCSPYLTMSFNGTIYPAWIISVIVQLIQYNFLIRILTSVDAKEEELAGALPTWLLEIDASNNQNE